MTAFDNRMVHLMEVVLDETITTGPIHQGLSRFNAKKYKKFIEMEEDDIMALEYKASTKTGTPYTPIPKGDALLLRAAHKYVFHMQTQHNGGKPYTESEFIASLTPQDFEEWRTEERSRAVNVPVPPMSVRNTTTASSLNPRDPVAEFQKGIKRDATLYTNFKDEKNWDTWQRSTVSTARAQKLDNILDSNYKPVTNEEKQLFDDQQKFLYDVFQRNIQTDQGRAYVREHETDYDAQTIWVKMKLHALTLTRATISSGVYLSYITSTKIGDGKWRGTAYNYILHWQEQVRLYDKLVGPTETVTDNQKITFLQNAVEDIPELHYVKNQALQDATVHHKQITYGQYSTLLLSAATGYDKKHGIIKSRSPGNSNPRRTVYSHDVFPQFHDDNVEEYSIETNVQTIQVNFARSSTMHRDKWKQLTEETQAIWDTITNDQKAIILGRIDKTNAHDRTKNPREVNLHDMSAHDFLQAYMLQQSQDAANNTTREPDTTDGQTPNEPPTTGPEATALLAFATRRQAASPGDIRNVLSSTTATDTDKKNKEMTIDGKRWQCID